MAFGYYKSVTMAAAQSGSANSTDWPLAICLDGNVQAADADLKTVANGGYVQNSSGYDIRPYADIGLTTPLTFELVLYTATTGVLEMHVKIPTLSFTVDTVIYLAFGDAGISTDGSSTGTWSANFELVHHYPNGSSLTTADSTSHGNNGTAVGATAIAGQMDGGANFNGTTNYISTAANFNATSQTWSVWVNISAFGAGAISSRRIVHQSDLAGLHETNLVAGQPGGNNRIVWYGYAVAGYQFNFDNGSNLSTSTNYLIHGTFDGANANLYINGALANTSAQAGAIGNATSPLFIGRINAVSADGYYSGKLDEVRLASDAKPASWCLADYNSQKVSSNFITWGSRTPFVSSSGRIGARTHRYPNIGMMRHG